MSTFTKTSEYEIGNLDSFGISKKDIEKINPELIENTEEYNKIIIGLIVGKIREKLDELPKDYSEEIIKITIQKIFKLLEIPIHITDNQKENIIKIEDLRSFISDGLHFKHIESRFLNNETEINNFLYSTEIFLNSSLKETN